MLCADVQCAGVFITPDLGGSNGSVVCGTTFESHTVRYSYSTPVTTSVTFASPTVSGCSGVYELGACAVKVGAAGDRRGVPIVEVAAHAEARAHMS